MARCSNILLNNLPYGFSHDQPKKMVHVSKDAPDYKEPYKTPVGGEVETFVCQLVVVFHIPLSLVGFSMLNAKLPQNSHRDPK